MPAALAIVAIVAGRWWLAAALVFCLAGDVLLLPQVDRFRGGLGAFLLAHLAFIGGLLTQPLQPQRAGFAAGAFVLVVVVAPRVLRAVPASLRPPVVAYMVVLVALNLVAALTTSVLALAGASCFAVSDSLLAWNRFVRPLPGGRLAVMVTYHLAIGLLTLSLAF